jgi:hypothetical protein
MQIRLRVVLNALAAAALWPAVPAQAQTAKDFEDLREQVRRLRDEVTDLKMGQGD